MCFLLPALVLPTSLHIKQQNLILYHSLFLQCLMAGFISDTKIELESLRPIA